MVYLTDASKWRAYQFLDPFAAGSFIVCNKINTHFCRPDCDAHPITELHLEIKFVATAADAGRLGFTPCKACDPMLGPGINVNLLLVTVREINAMIGFVPPLLDDDDEKVTERIKENIMSHNSVQRRVLVPMNAFSGKSNVKPASFAVSKNDSEHYRLIDLACRHLALAAATSIFCSAGSASESGASSPKAEDRALVASSSSSLKKKGSRKRRGGVLGFKELATKSKLSAWHFHRVFKSIIGLTPKTYGDMCWEFLEKEKEAMDSGNSPSIGSYSISKSLADAPAAVVPASRSTTPGIKKETFELDFQDSYLSPPQSHVSLVTPGSGQKRSRDAEELMPSPKRVAYNNSLSPQLSSFTNLKLEDARDALDAQAEGLGARAISEPNFGIYAAVPNSLFQHLRNGDFFVNREEIPSTDSMFTLALPLNDDHLAIGEEFKNSTNYLNEISPATIEDVSPLHASAMISPEMMPTSEMSLAMLDAQNQQGFTLAVDPINEEELFPNVDLFSDLFRTKNDVSTDYALNDPMISALAPELMSNIELLRLLGLSF